MINSALCIIWNNMLGASSMLVDPAAVTKKFFLNKILPCRCRQSAFQSRLLSPLIPPLTFPTC